LRRAVVGGLRGRRVLLGGAHDELVQRETEEERVGEEREDGKAADGEEEGEGRVPYAVCRLGGVGEGEIAAADAERDLGRRGSDQEGWCRREGGVRRDELDSCDTDGDGALSRKNGLKEGGAERGGEGDDGVLQVGS
jgi:hypothetical protein